MGRREAEHARGFKQKGTQDIHARRKGDSKYNRVHVKQ